MLATRYKSHIKGGAADSSVDLSALSILPSRVRLPSTPFTLLSFMFKFVLYLSLQCEKRTKINKKKPVLAHLKKIQVTNFDLLVP